MSHTHLTTPKHLFVVIALALSICGCEKKSQIPYREEIERGLTKQFNYLGIPRGQIQIMSGLSSQMESADMKQKRFPDKYLQFLQEGQKEGLLTFTETPQSQLDLIGSMGTRKLTVTPTSLAIDAADKQVSDRDYLYIPLGSCRVKTVVKDMEYHNPALPSSDDFRLVVGTYERSYSEFAQKQGVADKTTTFKFRALVKVNPFNHSYSFQVADWGNTTEDAWQSANIPN